MKLLIALGQIPLWKKVGNDYRYGKNWQLKNLLKIKFL